MEIAIVGVWILQGLLMTFDEFYFHHRRGLKKWESIGHPVDSLFFLATFLLCVLNPYSQQLELAFIALATISTLIITKDEWVHTEQCSARENWLHAMLFIIHPVALMCLFHAWKEAYTQIIVIQTVIIMMFTNYQILYWNVFTKGRYETRS